MRHRWWLATGLVLAAMAGNVFSQPEITAFRVPTEARIMGSSQRLSVTAQAARGETRSLAYSWTILTNPTGKAVIGNPTSAYPYLDIWWDTAATAPSAVGQRIRVKVEVSYTPPQENDLVASEEGELLLSGVNLAPVPVMSGNLGTTSNRIPSGTTVALSSTPSYDPDGTRNFLSTWGLGTVRGGSYLTPPVLYGSEGTTAHFVVPDMTSNIEQEVILTLIDGLHRVETRASAYLSRATTSGNTAPTLTLAASTVTVGQGAVAVFEANGGDANGDTLAFTWLFNSSTVNSSYVQTTRPTSTTWRSTFSLPTAGLAPGSYTVSVQAAETATSGRLTSPQRFGTLIVNPTGGGGDPGYFDRIQNSCSSNLGPNLVSMTPDPRVSQILLSVGQTASIELVFQDNSSRQSPLGGTLTGVPSITWDRTALTGRGITSVGGPATAMADSRQAKATLSFQVPVGQTGEARVTATATDVLDCTTEVVFGINFASGGQNTAPTARIRYDHDGDSVLSGPQASGYNVQTSLKSIALDATSSNDPENNNLTYSWSVTGISGATLASSAGATNTLTIPQAATSGTATVTLTATDSGGLSSSSLLLITVASTQNQTPNAKIRYAVVGGGWAGPFASGYTAGMTQRTVQLDGAESTDDSTGQLNFAWSVSGIPGAGLSSLSGSQTTLTVPESATGTVTITLTATDGGGLSGSSTLLLSYSAPPVPKIRYDLNSAGWVGPVSVGQQVAATQRTIKLDASQSTDDASSQYLTYLWYAQGIAGAELSSRSGIEATLTIPEEGTGVVVVTLTVTDGSGLSASTVMSFSVSGSGQAPVAKILFDEVGTGSYSGPFQSGHVVTTTHRTIALDGSSSTDDEGTGNLSYVWSVSGTGASLSAPSGAQATLSVPGSQQGSVTVVLTVTDSDSGADSTTLVFSYASSAQAPTAEITRFPEFVVAGEELEIEGSGQGETGRGPIVYDWKAVCCGEEGEPVQFYSGGTKARLVVPALELGQEEGILEVRLKVFQDGVGSDLEVVEIPVRRPQLYFAQMAVGQFELDRELLQFETSIVLVNNSDSAADGRIVFLNNNVGSEWMVLVDGEEVSQLQFILDPGAAREFVMTGEQVEIGWMKLTANISLTGHLFYRVVKRGSGQDSGDVISEVPILPVSGRTFRTALAPGANENIALALVNLSDKTAKFTIKAVQKGGSVLGTSDIELGSNQHLAKFLNEAFEDVGLPPLWSGFKGGTLVIETTEENALFVATIMKTTKDGLPMSILPVAVNK